ncbi:MAG: hypothetical protein AAFY60_20115 [Myxococcota bacterium]
MKTGDETRRINIVILEDQYQTLNQRNLNVSGLIRDLLGDYLSENVITLQVSEETRKLYETVVANTATTDSDIESHLRIALAEVLERQIGEMQALHQRLLDEQEKQK